MDAAVTARRLGARDVYLVYRRSFAEMPAWAEERDRFLAAGGHLMILTQPLGYVTDSTGKVCGVRICRTALGEPDQGGRRAPVVVPDSEGVLGVNLVVEAIGQSLDLATRAALEGVELSRGGLVALRENSQGTSLSGVFAGGDIVNGGKTAVQAIADGMQAAEEMHRLAAQAK
jgi:NADPH-dependent glutamate synthase beta subunit-like oxidoreductase